jgi:hypothetical protein
VLQLALRFAGGADPNFVLEINNVHSQVVDSAFLPQIRNHDGGGLRHVDERIDFAIGVTQKRAFTLMSAQNSCFSLLPLLR